VDRDVRASKGRTTTAAGLAALSLPQMLDKLSYAASWGKWSARQRAIVRCDPPDTVAKIILSRAGEWKLPRVAGVVTTPTLRPDGSILSAPSYDAATRLFHAVDPALRLPAMPENPTRRDADIALERLSGLVVAFPFVTGADRSVALSGIVTAVVRGALSVAPMHAFRAPTAGTGKSYFVDLCCAIATGRICPAITLPPREDEAEKRLVGLLLAGYPVISIDNVNGELGGDLLCQAIERSVVRVRGLGKSEIIEIDNQTTIYANGNNLRIAGDATRRTLLGNLDAGVERPELRTFDFDPVELVLDDRGTYIAACLTIVRAYRAAGSPDQQPPLASFEDWSRLVRSALCWLGCDDPCQSMEAARRDDPVLEELREMLGAWEQCLEIGTRYTTKDLADAAEAKRFDPDHGHAMADHMHPELREAVLRIAGDRGGINTRKLGNWIARYEGRIVGGLRLTRDMMQAHGSVVQWVVQRL